MCKNFGGSRGGGGGGWKGVQLGAGQGEMFLRFVYWGKKNCLKKEKLPLWGGWVAKPKWVGVGCGGYKTFLCFSCMSEFSVKF